MTNLGQSHKVPRLFQWASLSRFLVTDTTESLARAGLEEEAHWEKHSHRSPESLRVCVGFGACHLLAAEDVSHVTWCLRYLTL